MDHLKILGIKFIAIAFTVIAIFGVFNDIPIGTLLGISLLTTVISYLIGDLFLLRKFGNVIATIADFGLAFVSLWVLSAMFIGVGGYPIETISLLAAFFIACVEPFIHGYIVNRIPLETRKDRRTLNQLQTEFAEESDAQDIHINKDDKEK